MYLSRSSRHFCKEWRRLACSTLMIYSRNPMNDSETWNTNERTCCSCFSHELFVMILLGFRMERIPSNHRSLQRDWRLVATGFGNGLWPSTMCPIFLLDLEADKSITKLTQWLNWLPVGGFSLPSSQKIRPWILEYEDLPSAMGCLQRPGFHYPWSFLENLWPLTYQTRTSSENLTLTILLRVPFGC